MTAFFKWTALAVTLLLGIGFAALNPQLVSMDLYLVRLDASLGVLLLAALLLGALLAGLLLGLTVIAPQARRLARARRAQATLSAPRTDGLIASPGER